MKIALSTSENHLKAPLDPRFGRAARFILYDTETGSFDLIDNVQNLNAAQGAGIQAAQTVISAGTRAVISGHFGPKAFQVLTAAGITVYPSSAPTVEEALKLFQENKLTAAKEADVEGHWM